MFYTENFYLGQYLHSTVKKKSQALLWDQVKFCGLNKLAWAPLQMVFIIVIVVISKSAISIQYQAPNTFKYSIYYYYVCEQFYECKEKTDM